MALLEEITPGVLVKGLLPGGAVTIISVKRHGSTSVELVYQDANGHLGSELLYSDSVAHLEIVPAGLPWGVSMPMARSFAWSLKPIVSAWPTSSTRSSPCIPR